MNIIWTEPAAADLDSIYSFIASDSEYYARSFISKIGDSVRQLERFPQSGRIVPELSDEKICELIIRNYRIIYEIHESAIRILTILHAARELTDLNK